MSVIFEQLDSAFLYNFLHSKRASNASLIALAQTAQHVVLEYGRVTGAGIYDAPLLLNEKGQFRPLHQHAPQSMSKKIEFKATSYHATLRLLIELDLWLDAVVHVARNNPTLAETLDSAIRDAAHVVTRPM